MSEQSATKPRPRPLPMFIRPLRDAIREGRKTMTRRVVKPQPDAEGMVELEVWDGNRGPITHEEEHISALADFCPYGKPGDIAYLREPLARVGDWTFYKDSLDIGLQEGIKGGLEWRWKRDTLSHMLMPREAARTFVEIREVRVERLHEITEEDARAEGVTNSMPCLYRPDEWQSTTPNIARFAGLWHLINAKRGYSWESNPWVWAISFTKIP